MYQRILTVCTGNICRSPLAQAMLRLQAKADGREDVQLVSAGVRAPLDKPVDEAVLFVARSQPALLPLLEAHRSQPLTAAMTWWADLILVMEPKHVARVLKIDAQARDKIHALGRWTAHPSIADPHLKHEEVYREVHQQIAEAVLAWRDPINR
jgi:protein-tyrosine phosphatase